MLMKYNLIYFYMLEFGVKILFAKKAFTTKKKKEKSKDHEPKGWDPDSSAAHLRKNSKGFEARQTWGV